MQGKTLFSRHYLDTRLPALSKQPRYLEIEGGTHVPGD